MSDSKEIDHSNQLINGSEENIVVSAKAKLSTDKSASATKMATTSVAPAADDEDDVEIEDLPDLKIKGGEDDNGADDDDPDAKHKFKFDDGFVVDYREEPKTADIIASTEIDPVDGYRPITWKQLERVFCYQRPAHGFKLVGDISQKHREHWERSKQIRLRDKDGGEGALFFYDDKEPEPHFHWEDIEIGNVMEIRSPRLHKFMDGQDGMRIEHHNNVLRVNKVQFTDEKRLEYGVLNKNNGNKQFELAIKAKAKEDEDERVAKEKGVPYKKISPHMPNSAAKLFDNAINFYDMAIVHLERTLFVDDPANPASIASTSEMKKEREAKRQCAREALAACYLNIAASQILQRNWSNVEGPCEKALRVNASKSLNAKAYFRIGHAFLEQGHLRMAEEKLNRADQLNPNDPKIKELLHRIAVIRYEELKTEKEIFQMRQRRRAAEAEAAKNTLTNKKDAASADQKASSGGVVVDHNSNNKTATADDDVSPMSNFASSPAATFGGAPQSQKMNPNFGIRKTLFGPPQTELHGVANFRDLGGLTCNDGKTITKKYMIYRSSNLFNMTNGAEGESSNDLRILTEELGVKTVVDLRNQREIEMMCADAQRLRTEGGLGVHMKKLRRDEVKNKTNATDGEAREESDFSSNEESSEEEDEDDDISTSGSEGDDEETRHAKHTERNRKRKETRDKKRSERAAKRQEMAEEKAKQLLAQKPITGPFVDYRDYFTNIKVICAPKKKGSTTTTNTNTNSSFASPTMQSESLSSPVEGSPSGSGTSTTTTGGGGGSENILRRIFMYLSGGDTHPALMDRTSLVHQPQSRVWLRLIQKQKCVAVPRREPPLENEDEKSKKKKKSVEEEIAFSLSNRRTILHIDVVTRSFISVASVWVLLGVAFYFLCFQVKKASQLIARHVVEKGPSYMYQIIVDHQGPEIAQIFALAADESNYPIVFTCALGKDRTGVIIALLLAAADVKFDLIARDYAQLTNENLSPGLETNVNPPNNADAAEYLVDLQRSMGVVGPWWDVANPKDIRTLFLHLKNKYGGLHAYLSKIGVTADQIQSIRRILTRPIAGGSI